VKELLSWEPLVWTIRTCAVILVVLATYVALLYAARYLRPRTVKAMVFADPPTFRNATVEAFGAKIGGELHLAEGRNAQVTASIEERLDDLQRRHDDLRAIVVKILRTMGRGGNDGFSGV
jgi:hypothetical protein